MKHTAQDVAVSGDPPPSRSVSRLRIVVTALIAVATATISSCAGVDADAAPPETGTTAVTTLSAGPSSGSSGRSATNFAARAGSPSSVPPKGSGPKTAGTAGTIAPKLPDTDLAQGVSTPVEDPYYPATSNPEVDSLHYGLDLDWDGRTLRGVTQLTFRATKDTSTVRLGLLRTLAVSGVTLDDTAVGTKRIGDDLVIATGPLAANSRHVLVIKYKGQPRSVPAPSGRLDMTEGLGWNRSKAGNISTFQEPYGAYTWYAVNDHPSDKARYDATIRVPRGLVGVFNGTLTTSQVIRGKTVTRWHLDRPAASYLTTLAIGKYKHSAVQMTDGKPFNIWLLPKHEKLRPAIAREARRSYSWLLSRAGPYPFATSGVVVVEGDSAMETQTLITAGYESLQAELDGVILHELAHQWYGDSVGPIDWLAVWLNEGWATRMQFDYQDPRGVMYDLAGLQATCRWARVAAGPPARYDRRQFAEDNVYVCPAAMLTQLRNTVGVAKYNEIAKAWPAEHRDHTVNRATFLAWLNAQTGSDHSALLKRWLD